MVSTATNLSFKNIYIYIKITFFLSYPIPTSIFSLCCVLWKGEKPCGLKLWIRAAALWLNITGFQRGFPLIMSRKRTWIQVPNSTLTFRIQIIKVDLIFFAHIFVCLTFLFQPTVSQGCATLSGRWIQLQEHIQTTALSASLLPGHRGARWGQSGQPSGQWSPGAGEPAQLKPATFLRGWMNTGAPVVQISSYLCCTHRGVFIVALCTTLSYITAEYWVEHLLFEGICPSVITAEIPLGLHSPIHCSIAAQKKQIKASVYSHL